MCMSIMNNAIDHYIQELVWVTCVPVCPYPNILFSKSHKNVSKYMNIVANYAYLDHLRSMTSNDP